MARASQRDTEAQVAEMTSDETPEFPDWAVRAAQDSQLVVQGEPSPNQWRRQLTPHELMQWVERAASGDQGFDPESILELFARAAQATTTDALYADQETVKGRTIPDVLLRVDNVRFKLGQYEDGCPYFGILHAVRTDNERPEVISLGGWVIAAQLGQMHYLAAELPADSPYVVDPSAPGAIERWEYPQYVRIKRRPTSRGFHVNSLVHPLLGA
jgi:hypothetical protein